MKRPRSTASLSRLGLLVALVAAATFTGRAQAAPLVNAPAPAPGGDKVVALTAGAVHTCATLGDKTVRCWGNNQYGELGNGTTVNAAKPTDVRGFASTPVTTLTRAVHNCSIVDSRAVECWGMNKYGQLGDGTAVNSPKVIPVKGVGDRVRLLGVGGDHTCVTLEDDSTWCWGQNKYGELGDGRIYLGSRQPVQVKGLPSRPVTLAAALWHTCAVLENGSTWCWGHNEEGELGVGRKLVASATPLEVRGLPSTPVKIAAGLFHTCAVVKDGSTWCWGQNKYGQLGNGSNDASWTPKQVSGLDRNPTHLVAGGFHTCATSVDGVTSCWGQNNFGQLGNGTTGDVTKPVKVKDLRPNPTLVAAGSLHTCAAYADGAVSCWGLNQSGQLGSGTFSPSATRPVPVVGLTKPAAPVAAPVVEQAGTTGGTSIGTVALIGLPVLAVVGLVVLIGSRRSRSADS